MLQLRDPQTKRLRQFLIRKKYEQKEFYRRIQVEENKRRLLLFRLAKKELQDRDLGDHLEKIINSMNKINHSSMSKPEGVLEDAKYLYVVMIDDMLVSLVELIEKREKLTEFELKYFFTELYYSVNHLKNQGYVFAKLSMDNIIIDSSVKLNFGFSLWLCEVQNLTKTRRLIRMNGLGQQTSCIENNINKIILWEMALMFYYLVEGHPLINNQYDREQVMQNKIKFKNTTQNSEVWTLINKMLLNKDFKLNDIPYDTFLKKDIPKVLPQSIIYCPPSKRFQQDILKSIRTQEALNQKKRYIQLPEQKKNYNNQIFHTQRTEDDELVYVDEFCDITCRFGYGYKMSNGLIGFYYNDRTLLLLIESSDGRQLHYFDENWSQKVYKQQKLIDQHDLKKKLYILDAFRKAICQFKKQVSIIKNMVFIKNYVKVKNAKIFLLSNDTAQSKFIDNTQILCTPNAPSLYFDKKTQQFAQISKQDGNEVLIRQNYTKELAMKLFNWQKITENNKEQK